MLQRCHLKRGDIAKVGTPIAKAGGFVSANIHSSVSGTVQKLEEKVDASGYPKLMITIQSDRRILGRILDR